MTYEVGKSVICISDWFPLEYTELPDKSGLGKPLPLHPKKGEILVIYAIYEDEYLSFQKYNYDGCINWWLKSKFRLLDDIPIIMNIEIEEEFHI